MFYIELSSGRNHKSVRLAAIRPKLSKMFKLLIFATISAAAVTSPAREKRLALLQESSSQAQKAQSSSSSSAVLGAGGLQVAQTQSSSQASSSASSRQLTIASPGLTLGGSGLGPSDFGVGYYITINPALDDYSLFINSLLKNAVDSNLIDPAVANSILSTYGIYGYDLFSGSITASALTPASIIFLKLNGQASARAKFLAALNSLLLERFLYPSRPSSYFQLRLSDLLLKLLLENSALTIDNAQNLALGYGVSLSIREANILANLALGSGLDIDDPFDISITPIDDSSVFINALLKTAVEKSLLDASVAASILAAYGIKGLDSFAGVVANAFIPASLKLLKISGNAGASARFLDALNSLFSKKSSANYQLELAKLLLKLLLANGSITPDFAQSMASTNGITLSIKHSSSRSESSQSSSLISSGPGGVQVAQQASKSKSSSSSDSLQLAI